MPPASIKRITRLQLVTTAAAPIAPRRAVGRVRHDERGNAVWDWDVEPGTQDGPAVDELIGSLAAPISLSVEGEERQRDWSGDPYNRSR